MDLNETNCYLSGLLDTASSVSVWMGPSYVVAEVFENDGFFAEFYGYYRLDPDVLLDTVTSFETLLKQWFGDEEKPDKKTVSALLYHMEKCFGKAEKVYSVKEDSLPKLEKKNSPVPFTFVEDMAVVRFEKYTVCFVLGNNE
ncbi:MAG: hypothetical protein IKH51_07870 [Clostridia bacterium]|nr:hypothetical protein [Clostridia bacterium]